jgi:hypothetical protein
MRAGCDVHATDNIGRTGRDLARLGTAHGWSDGMNASARGLAQIARPAFCPSIPIRDLN